jgi:hypothetical protein
VTFSGPAKAGPQTFGPYAGVSLEPADHDYEVLVLNVSATGPDAGDEDGDGRCLAARVDGVWKLGDGTDEGDDGPGYERVSFHQKSC